MRPLDATMGMRIPTTPLDATPGELMPHRGLKPANPM